MYNWHLWALSRKILTRLAIFTWQSIRPNKLAISAEFPPKSIRNTPRRLKTSMACTIPFYASLPGTHVPHLPLPKICGPFFSGHERSPLYKLSRALRRKNLCGCYPNCLPTSWTDTGWVNTTGFWLLCLREHGEPPVSNAYVFACFSESRCQISYPWLHTFSGYRLISSSEVHRCGCAGSTWVSIVGPFFTCCWYWVCFTVSRDADFMMGMHFPHPPGCCYIYIFCGDGSRRLLRKLQRNFLGKSRSVLLFVVDGHVLILTFEVGMN